MPGVVLCMQPHPSSSHFLTLFSSSPSDCVMAFTGVLDTKKMVNLLGLPPEVLHGILRNTDPQDLARLCCCRTLYQFIKNDWLLYKELYLRNFVKLSP